MLLARFGLLLAVAGGVAGCAHGDGGSAAELTGRQWVLVELTAGPPLKSAPYPGMRLDAASGRVGGSTGVNQYSGAYALNGTSLSFGPLVSTRRAGPEAAMAVESAFLGALASTASLRLTAGALELRDAKGAPVARFAPAAGQ